MTLFYVNVNANALRTIKVRAESGREAMDIARNRIQNKAGPWYIDFPGTEDEHFTVALGPEPEDRWVGPYSDGSFEDEEDEDEDLE